MPKTLYVTDLDGTLLDTLDDLTDSVNYAMSGMGWPLRDRRDVRLFLGNGIKRLMELCSPEGISGEEFDKEMFYQIKIISDGMLFSRVIDLP